MFLRRLNVLTKTAHRWHPDLLLMIQFLVEMYFVDAMNYLERNLLKSLKFQFLAYTHSRHRMVIFYIRRHGMSWINVYLPLEMGWHV